MLSGLVELKAEELGGGTGTGGDGGAVDSTAEIFDKHGWIGEEAG